MVFCTVIGEGECDRTSSTEFVCGVLCNRQLIVGDRYAECDTIGWYGCTPSVDLSNRALLVVHVTDVRLACVRDVSKELGHTAESFRNDVRVGSVIDEDWHTISTLFVTDIWLVVDVVDSQGHVLCVSQAVAVCYNELELNSTKLISERCDGNGLTVLVPFDQYIAVRNGCSFCDGPCESFLFVLDIVSEVGQRDDVCFTVLVNCIICESSLNFRTCSLDVDGELLVGRHRNSVNSCPVICTVCLCLDHHIVVLCRSCGGGTLVGTVDKYFIADATCFQVTVSCLERDVLSK